MKPTVLAMLVMPMTVAAWAQAPAPSADAAASALVQQNCAACHPITQVTTAHKTKEDWAAAVDKMIGFGAQISDKDYDVIVDYLAAHQGVRN